MSWQLTKAQHAPGSENETPEEGQWISEIREKEMTRMRGGMIETSNTGTTRRGAALGQWERIGNDLFATSMWLFRFDPATGTSLGTQEIDRTMRLSADGESFTAVAVIHVFDSDGNQVGDALHATEVGTRLAINRNPDQP